MDDSSEDFLIAFIADSSCGTGGIEPGETCEVSPPPPTQPNCRPGDCRYCGDNRTDPPETCDASDAGGAPLPGGTTCRPASATGPGDDHECTHCGDGNVDRTLGDVGPETCDGGIAGGRAPGDPDECTH